MLRKLSRGFSNFLPDQVITIRSQNGERRLHLTGVQRLMIGGALVALVGYGVTITGMYAYRLMSVNSLVERRAELTIDYEERIRELVDERDRLATNLDEVQASYALLVSRLGAQQDLIFEAEREKIELGYNVERLRTQAVAAQNTVDALDLQIETQQQQIAALNNGEGLDQHDTLNTMSSTLAATAQARDDARAEAERLRLTLETNIAAQEAASARRNEMLAHLEEAVDLSLTPMETALRQTGLDVDNLLREIRRNYSGVGGLAPLSRFQPIGDTAEETARFADLKDNLEKVSLLSTAIQQLPMMNPVQASHRVTSGFGYRRHPIYGGRRMHSGIDMAAPYGTPILAPGDGVVVRAGWISGYGRSITIRHANGVETLYAHMQRLRVSQGDRVSRGQQIGDMGSSGNSTGSHLHYEVKINGQATNPDPFMKAQNYVR